MKKDIKNIKNIASFLVFFSVVSLGLFSCNKTDTEKPVQVIVENTNKIPTSLEESLNNLDKTESIAGIDANNDGIRDDVENVIELLEESRKVKNQLRYFAGQIAKDLLVNTGDLEALLDQTYLLDKAISCARDEDFQDQESGLLDNIKLLEATTYNTEERFQAYLANSKALEGQRFRGYEGECPDYSETEKQKFDFSS